MSPAKKKRTPKTTKKKRNLPKQSLITNYLNKSLENTKRGELQTPDKSTASNSNSEKSYSHKYQTRSKSSTKDVLKAVKQTPKKSTSLRKSPRNLNSCIKLPEVDKSKLQNKSEVLDGIRKSPRLVFKKNSDKIINDKKLCTIRRNLDNTFNSDCEEKCNKHSPVKRSSRLNQAKINNKKEQKEDNGKISDFSMISKKKSPLKRNKTKSNALPVTPKANRSNTKSLRVQNNKIMKLDKNLKIDDFLHKSPMKNLKSTPQKYNKKSPSSIYFNRIPKVKEILKNRKEKEEYQNINKEIEKMLKKFQEIDRDKKDEIIEEISYKYCTHLTPDQIRSRFDKDVEYLDNIFHGRTFCERHEKFKTQTPHYNFTTEDLRIDDSVSAFTIEQLTFIISLFRERFDNGNIYKWSDYYMKVLLPEYCTKIFMDVYEMTRAEAILYLKTLPTL